MKSVLIVDDDSQNIYMLHALLSGHGYRVATAANGAEALQLARQDPPDMVVADILMPVMDGFELCRQWKKDPVLGRVPFVFYTATYTDPKDEEFARNLGAERFIVKPQDPDALIEMLAEVLREHRVGGATPPAEPQSDEKVYFRQYNEALIRKLEQKMVQLEGEVATRREVEAVLRASEERYRRLFETMLQGVLYQDRDGTITDANPAAERILGLSLDEMRGQTSLAPSWLALAEDGSEIPGEAHPATVALRTGRAVEGVVVGIVAPHETAPRWVRIDAIPLFAPGEQAPHQVYVIFEDVTERRRSEAERELSARCLEILNGTGDGGSALRQVMLAIKDFAQVQAVGLRLREGDGFPYRQSSGFPQELPERGDCSSHMGRDAGPPRDEEGGSLLEHLSEMVLNGCADRSHPLFTEAGSFWTNSSAALSAVAAPWSSQASSGGLRLGYESVALVPVRSGPEAVGLLHLCDSRPDRLSPELIRFLEGLGSTMGIALARKRAEDALRESEELYRRIVQDQTEMICRCLPDGTITFLNDACRRFFRRPGTDLVGTDVYALVRKETATRLREAVASLSVSQPTVTMELPFPLPDGRGGWSRWTHRGFFDETEQLLAVQSIGSDITSLKMAEGEHRLAALGQLAAGVAHDFNNLLQGMSGTAELVEMGADSQKLVDIVLRSTRSGSEITRNLMAFARPEQPRREGGHLERALEAALAVADRQLRNADVRVVRQYAQTPHTVVFDATQMQQVFLNLIINAGHAMSAGGTLTIGTQYQPSGTGPVEALVWVADTGTGIAPEHLDRIFEPFFSTKGRFGESEAPGSGLGLSVSHGFVTAHGGTIAVSSELGVGTRFEVRLPLAEEAAAVGIADPAALTPEDAAGLRGARILLVEDEPPILDLLQRFLGDTGCETTTARSAAEALDALRAERPDLVLCDLMVPGGGGRAVMEFARGMGTAAPPVVIMSGRIERALHDEILALGAARTIEKPFALGALLRALAQVLGSQPR